MSRAPQHVNPALVRGRGKEGERRDRGKKISKEGRRKEGQG